MRFMPNVTSFSSPDKVPENQCYCHQEPCLPSGLLDISGCEPDSPIYLSWPHFLHGDPYLRNLVKGLAPDEQAHSFILDVLPVKKLGNQRGYPKFLLLILKNCVNFFRNMVLLLELKQDFK